MSARTWRGLAAAAVLLLVLPGVMPAHAQDASDVPAYPDDYAALAKEWVVTLRADAQPFMQKNWSADVTRAIERAEAFAEAGRPYAAGHEAMSTRTAIAFYLFWDDFKNVRGNSSRQARATVQGDAWRDEADAAARSFRAELKTFEAEIEGLLALESALYASSWFMESHFQRDTYEVFKQEIAKPGQLDAGLMLGIASVTVGAEWGYRYASDLLELAVARDGVAPRFVKTAFANLTAAAYETGRSAGETGPPTTRGYDRLMKEASGTQEGILASGALLASLRTQRVTGVQTMFGDAAGRGIDAGSDLWDNINRSLANPALPRFTEISYEGLPAISGLDEAVYIFDSGALSLAQLARAWIAIEDARTLGGFYEKLSPTPRPAQTNGTDGAGEGGGAGTMVAVVAAVGVVAVALLVAGRRAKRSK